MGLTLGILAAQGKATAAMWDVPGCCRMDNTSRKIPGMRGHRSSRTDSSLSMDFLQLFKESERYGKGS